MKQTRAVDQEAGGFRARDASRRSVLEILRESPAGSNVQSLAERTGLHPNTVRFHLDRLEREGLVSRRVVRRSEPGRPPLTFTATPRPDANRGRRDFGVLAQVLAGAFAENVQDGVGAAVDAGRSWGVNRTVQDRLDTSAAAAEPAAAVAVMVQVLERMGFAPESSAQGRRTTLLHRHCPFLEVAETHQEVVCSVHLGFIRGVLERLQTPLVAESLVPFATGQGCEAHLLELPGQGDTRRLPEQTG